MKRYILVGAGAAGLTLGYHLCKAGLPVTILEKESQVGGLARSFRYDEWAFDIGPHRFYSANPQVMRFLTEVLGSTFVTISRDSAVHFMGKYHDWPLRLATVFKLPPAVALGAGLDMLRLAGREPPREPSFENYILRKYGPTLYSRFFRDYTEKFLGVPAARTHQHWAKIGVERATIDKEVNTASLLNLFKLMLIPKPRELNFWYPRGGGVHVFWKAAAEKVRELGGEILTSTVPKRLEVRGDRIHRVVVGDRAIPCRELVWSGPIPELCQHLGLPPAELHYRDHVLYNVLLNNPPRHGYQWCYYGARDIVFSRISNPATFCPDTVPEGRGGLCVEIPCQRGDALWDDPERVKKKVVDDLIRVGMIHSAEEIYRIQIEKVPFAYPIYHIDYPEKLRAARRRLKAYSNLTLLGRTGKFWYNNMDHSMENAFRVAGDLLGVVEPADQRVFGVLEELGREPAPRVVAAAGA